MLNIILNIYYYEHQRSYINDGNVINKVNERLMIDRAELMSNGISFIDSEDDHNFTIIVQPNSGYYKSCTFNFRFNIPKSYPLGPPKVRCLTPIYHPNIDASGEIYLNILPGDYLPILTLYHILRIDVYFFGKFINNHKLIIGT